MKMLFLMFDFFGPFSQKVNKDIMWWLVPILLLLPLITSAIFYLGLNGKNTNSDRWAKNKYWFMFGISNSIILFLCSILISYNIGSKIHPYYFIAGLTFALVCFILFYLFSIIIRKYSTQAKYYPNFKN